MKFKVCLLTLLASFFSVGIVYAEGYMNWDKLTIRSSDLETPLAIQIEGDKKRISKLEVQIKNRNISVPTDQFENSNNPQLHTTKIGYWNPEELDFYIAIKCGVHSSFPDQPQPQIIFFIFKNGKYSHMEAYDILNPPSFSLELNRMIKKGKTAN